MVNAYLICGVRIRTISSSVKPFTLTVRDILLMVSPAVESVIYQHRIQPNRSRIGLGTLLMYPLRVSQGFYPTYGTVGNTNTKMI